MIDRKKWRSIYTDNLSLYRACWIGISENHISVRTFAQTNGVTDFQIDEDLISSVGCSFILFSCRMVLTHRSVWIGIANNAL